MRIKEKETRLTLHEHDDGDDDELMTKRQKATFAYRNTKQKLLKSKVAVWFNKMRRSNRLTPKCVNIMVSGNN